ncbi:MAG: hypothetical protein J6B77_04795 [Clostridia bacterium]|nr:hypothetical protein [Clostridia bacterium]
MRPLFPMRRRREYRPRSDDTRSVRLRTYLVRISSALLALLLIFFCFYHLTTLHRSEVQTMLVTKDTVEKTLVGDAVLFRTESAVTDDENGLCVPTVPSCTHVGKGTALGAYYTDGAEYRAVYRSLTEQIDALTAAKNEKDAPADLKELRQTLLSTTYGMIDTLSRGDAAASHRIAEELRVLYSRLQALTDAEFSLDTEIAALNAERDRLLGTLGTDAPVTVTSAESGHYYPYADGYAALCHASRLETATAKELASIAETLRTTEAPVLSAGTLVTDPEWFLALPITISAEEVATLSFGTTYTVIFPENDGTRIPMTLERMIEGDEEHDAALVFSTLRVPPSFSFERLQTVRVVTETHSGFSIPCGAVHTLDGNTGVYVLEGSIMYFRRVEILLDLGTRYLVKTTDPTPGGEFIENTYRYVALYDAIVVSGTKLFHGRVLS